MRILITPSWYPTPTNPVNGIFIREQADALHKVHEVWVLYLEVLPRSQSRKPQHRFSRERGYIEEIIEVPNRCGIWQFTYLWYMLKALWRLHRRFSPDIIHCHIAVPAGWAVAMLRPFLRIPIVLTENSSEFGPWLGRPGLRWMARAAFSGVDVVIAVSEGLKLRIRQTFRQTGRIMIVPNIVDTSRFVPMPMPATFEGYRILFVGLLETPQKGVPVLLESLAQIRRGGKLQLHLDLVGDGALRSSYEAQAQQLGLEEVVTFHGLQSHEAIALRLQQSHALVLPSLHEALPLAIIEALVSGRPVISTRCGGPEYMLDTTNGLIVEPGRADLLAGAITDLLTHLDRYDPRRIAADASSRYSYSAVAYALNKIYLGLVRKNRKGK